MGLYVNPGNSGFLESLNDVYYADKTGLIVYFNSLLSTKGKEIVFTRPRRFGKTTACNMLAAYYSRGCKSEDLFTGMDIAKDASFQTHLNKHPVIFFDLYPFMYEWSSGRLEKHEPRQTMVQFLQSTLVQELAKEYPDAKITPFMSLYSAMFLVSQLPVKEENESNKFIVIIDEWDMVLREGANDPEMIGEYIEFLRSIFRPANTSEYLAGAYMTGILPIIKYNTQSALSDFFEYTMLNPEPLSKYVGFTKEDVYDVCQKLHGDEKRMKEWYDGYNLPSVGDVYCPSSVIKAIKSNDYSSHWTSTSAMEALTDYIYLNIDGLRDAMNELLDGKNVDVDPKTFQNRPDDVDSRDKVLTVLIHLGYLAYDYYSGTARIPNLEVRLHMLNAFKQSPDKSFFTRVKRCEKALLAVKNMNAQTVAEVLKEIHDERPPIHYNDEQALRYVVLMAFNNSPMGRYTSFEELSSGTGFVDILFKPQKGFQDMPILVELKHNRSSSSAVAQIHQKDYVRYLKKDGYKGDVLFVGVNYSSRTRKHTCKIEKVTI